MEIYMIKVIELIFILVMTASLMKEFLHQFLYNPMINECGWVTISTHRTPEGAEKAKQSHRSDAYNDWLEEYPTQQERELHPFGRFEDWRTSITELLD